MFHSEKELVDKLVVDVQERYDTKFIVTELRGGNNIADIAYTTSIQRNNIVFDEYYNAFYYFQGIYKKKKISLDEVSISDKKLQKKFHIFLKELEELGYISIDGNNIRSIKKVDEVTKKFIAIEAKLSDWKLGLEQALRYKIYADEVYIAISSEYVKNVDKQLLVKNNVGLMSVSHGKLKIPVRAKRNEIEDIGVQFYMVDRFLKQLKQNEIALI